ncbi:hydroxymethylglutaryl-CoA synthase 1 [Coccinella septempunctata]|uniref:hydroxymethylglutaryl-CoA synthase 1 n=1 Tax=Coccinella septempunctata TaxID=41139 RepID=UPI001D065182|nr:hydroxymethylglutaryl-CoA synthase 1 [Coccinella septempunctata]
MGSWPDDVGIVAIELTIPSLYVDQEELEKYDGVSSGKYTVGLGQKAMGVCTDREDVNSLCLTVVHKLLEKNHIDYSDIGRLEVGTETIIDKSKSVKSVLMQLFEPHGVTDIEGIDTTNACFGGTAALFNAISWVESSAWNGKYALVVAADIAVYAKGAARPTGGAGAVAMLIGPNAPLVFDRGLRAVHMRHVYDFYKPDLSSEYPVVDSKLSIQCYLSALDKCYQTYCEKASKFFQKKIDLSFFDAILFHTPYCKLVQKSLARLYLNDFYLASLEQKELKYPELKSLQNIVLEKTYFDKDVEKAVMNSSKELFSTKTSPSLLIASQVGNMYTPSLYGGLVSLLVSKNPAELAGKRVGLFSYGSGLASAFYSLKISEDGNNGTALQKLISNLTSVKINLHQRQKIEPQEFEKFMDIRQKSNHSAPYEPLGSIESFFPGTYYLTKIDEKYRRSYDRVPNAMNGHAH